MDVGGVMLRGIGLTSVEHKHGVWHAGLNAAHSGLVAGYVSGVVVKSEPVRKDSPDRKDAFVIHDARSTPTGRWDALLFR